MRTYRLSRRNEVGGQKDPQPRTFPIATQTSKDIEMTATGMIKIVDRFALGLMNVMVMVGLPLVAFGLVAQWL